MEQMKLIQQSKKGDTQAFAELYSSVYQDLYRFALYTLKNRHDAEDAVSDAVTDAWAQIGSLRRTDSFKSWIFKILSNKCRRRLKQYLDKTEELPEDLCAEEKDTDGNLDVRAAFARLEDEERLILSMHIFGGYTSREIGSALQMSDSTVRSKQKRALDKMEDWLS